VPDPRPPQGVEHFYAPLARITVGAARAVTVEEDFRRRFPALARCNLGRLGGALLDERDTSVSVRP
jgi:hypothetical protein